MTDLASPTEASSVAERSPVAGTRIGESAADWPDVLVVTADAGWRLIRSRDERPATQWIVQRRRGAGWVGLMFFQSGDAMRHYHREALRLEASRDRREIDDFWIDPAVGAVVDALPETCSQRSEALLSDALKARGQAGARARWKAA